VVELNNLYHAFEAKDYYRNHPEVYEQLPSLWKQMIDYALERFGSRVWHILDFGCGGGFEAEQLIRNLPEGSIARLTCYDLSPEMLDLCRARITPFFSEVSFSSNLQGLLNSGESYNLLATNSFLHHLPDPITTINGLFKLLAPDAVWIAGHEPSIRFYRNIECIKTWQRFLNERKWTRFLSLANYSRRLRQIAQLASNPTKQTAVEAFRRRLFKRRPPASLVGRLVDFHVPSLVGGTIEEGFDFRLIQQELVKSWQLCWVKTYSFMGNVYEGNISARWRRICDKLACAYPEDGANFCTVWKRI
jgi:2-polyprenyl-3-methyl-5-hydroxy-6-metoxy-1,4-benzoquinol methylase